MPPALSRPTREPAPQPRWVESLGDSGAAMSSDRGSPSRSVQGARTRRWNLGGEQMGLSFPTPSRIGSPRFPSCAWRTQYGSKEDQALRRGQGHQLLDGVATAAGVPRTSDVTTAHTRLRWRRLASGRLESSPPTHNRSGRGRTRSPPAPRGRPATVQSGGARGDRPPGHPQTPRAGPPEVGATHYAADRCPP
jgi:hypothetical protein